MHHTLITEAITCSYSSSSAPGECTSQFHSTQVRKFLEICYHISYISVICHNIEFESFQDCIKIDCKMTRMSMRIRFVICLWWRFDQTRLHSNCCVVVVVYLIIIILVFRLWCYDMVSWYGMMIWYDLIYNMIWYDRIWCDKIRFGMTWYDMICRCYDMWCGICNRD